MAASRPPSRRGLSAADKRQLRYERSQSELTPEEIAAQAQQNKALSLRALAITTANEMKNSKRWFEEFMKFNHPNVEVDTTYYAIGAGIPSTVILKEYARYLVRSRVGRIGGKLTIKTMNHYMNMAISVMQRACNHAPEDVAPVRKEIFNFISADLPQQEGITDVAYHKAVAHSDDFTFIVSKLYSSLSRFPNMRTVLNLTLFMTLMIDLTGRGCEIARNPQRPEHMCLRWEDVKFFSFQGEEDETFEIKAHIQVRWAKGKALNDNICKIVPLPGLLPTSMRHQDSLRLLITLALMDGIFSEDIRTWDDLQKLRLPAHLAKTGRCIPMKPEKAKLPVLRRMQKKKLTDEPVHTMDMQTEIRRLGELCGFEHRLTAYCLRRGVVYVLAHQVQQEDRLFLMGHTSNRHYRHYQSIISSVDSPALFRGLDNRPLSALEGISLNRSDALPLTASEEMKRAIMSEAEVQSAFAEMETARAALRAKHPSLEAASRSSDILWEDFKSANAFWRAVIKTITKRYLKLRRTAHFSELRCGRAASSDKTPMPENEIPDAVQKDIAAETSPLFIAEDEDTEVTAFWGSQDSDTTAPEMIDPEFAQLNFDDVATTDQALEMIDPFLRGEDSSEISSDDEEASDADATHTVEPSTTPHSTSADEMTDSTDMALHGNYDNNLSTRMRNRLSVLKNTSAYKDFTGDLDGKDTEAGVYECMML